MATAYILLLLPILLHLGVAQIYLQCDENEFTSEEGCICWSPHNPIISCTSLGLKRIPKITKAHTLNLNNNSLTYITEHHFKRLIGLKRLILSNNLISAFHYRAFNNMVGPGLELFDLDHNMLDKVPEIFSANRNGFEGTAMANLTVLRLSHNLIDAIARGAFRGAPKMRELYLDGNPITRILPYAWKGISNLQRLEISPVGMDIKMIPTKGVEGLTSLRLVGPRPQRLDIMEPWFSVFSSLQHLTLENMGLSEGHFCKGRFPSPWNTSLRGLSLRDNELRAIPYHILELPQLQEFDISRNWIKRIEQRWPRIPIQLQKLNVSDNIIDYLGSRQLLGLGNARVIDISNNRLSSMQLTKEKIDTSLPANTVLYLGGNPWACRCYNRWVRDIVGSNHLTQYESSNTYRCGSGGSNHGDLIKDVPIGNFCKH